MVQVVRSIVREAEFTKSYSDETLYITGILRHDKDIKIELIKNVAKYRHGGRFQNISAFIGLKEKGSY